MATVTFKTTNVEDTYLDSTTVSTNYGSSAELYCGELAGGTANTRILIKFPLDDGTIPAGSTIVSATLRIYKLQDFATNTRNMEVRRVVRTWVEGQATWNEASSGVSWGTAGGGNQTTDIEATTIGTRSFTHDEAVNEYAEWSLTASKIQEMITGGSFTNKGFFLATEIQTDDAWRFASTNNATAAQRPELVVVYTPLSRGGSPVFFQGGGLALG